MSNTLYEKTYRAGIQNKRNAILNFVFIALCLVYFFVLIFTTENESDELGESLSLAIRLIGCTMVLIGASVLFLINGTASAIISSKMLKMSQGEKIKKGVFTASAIIKIITALALIVAAGLMILYGFYVPLDTSDLLFIGDLLFALVLAGFGVYQMVLIIREGKSRKELFSV